MSPSEKLPVSKERNRLTPDQIEALLSLSLHATTLCGPYVEEINTGCMLAINPGTDREDAKKIVGEMLKTASSYPELSVVVQRVSRAFDL